MDLSSVQFLPLLPEIVIALTGCAVLIIDLVLKREDRHVVFLLTLAALAAAAVMLVADYGAAPRLLYFGTVAVDDLSTVIRVGVVSSTLLLLVYARQYNRDRGLFTGEYFALVLFGVTGMMVLASGSHLLTLYVGLELLSLCMYALIAMQRDSGRASEAAMKYFVLGALASGVLLYGMSLLYGLTGTLELHGVAAGVVALGPDSLPLTLAVVFVVVGLAFKLGAAPFHMWVPDVYHGSPTSATIFIGSAPKLAAFALVARLWSRAWASCRATGRTCSRCSPSSRSPSAT